MQGRNQAPVAIDLFAGAGGLGEGLEASGIAVAAATELHPQPALTYAFNHPDTSVIAGDIRDLDLDLMAEAVRMRSRSEQVDVVVGGPPCQGFSTAGKKAALDPRNNLFMQFARVVEHFRPRMFLMENVPGFKKMYDGRAYQGARDILHGLGYETVDTLIRASEHGVPQRRLRFVMVGWLPGKAKPFTFPAATHGDGQDQPLLPGLGASLAPLVTVEDAIGDLAFLEPGWEAHRHQVEAISEFQAERRDSGDLLFNHLATRHRQRALDMFVHIAEGSTISAVPEQIRSAKRTMARLHRARISNAVVAMPDDLIHYQHNRILSVREMARLQTFDDDYVFLGKRTSGFVERRVDVPQYTQVGNAVPVVLARVLGRALLASLGAPERDIRDRAIRRARHQWVRSSSGFAGYTLDRSAEGQIDLRGIDGALIALPLDDREPLVVEAPGLVEWKTQANPRRGQWAPGVDPRPMPAYVG